jgi:hypothetical protein
LQQTQIAENHYFMVGISSHIHHWGVLQTFATLPVDLSPQTQPPPASMTPLVGQAQIVRPNWFAKFCSCWDHPELLPA